MRGGVVFALLSNEGFRVGLLATAYGFGFRHGIDWDHIAAITDITTSQDEGRRSLLFATLYALGHGLVVLLLGIAAIVAGQRLPSGVDAVMGRIVGVTLLLLGAFVFYSLIRHGRDFRMRSRWMLVFGGVRKAWRRLRPVVIDHEHEHAAPHHHEGDDGPARRERPANGGAAVAVATKHAHSHRHLGSLPDDPFMNYGKATAFGVGMLHGVGAETPTQLLLFVAAAGVGGRTGGLFMLLAFLAGLLSSNSLIAVASTFGFLKASRNFALYATVAVLTGTFSLVIGTIFALGHSTALPAIFGG
jgi:ABC-type nickel/cobalt efflux system permease component RcnA